MEFYFDDRPHEVALEHMRRVNLQIHERFRIRDNNDPLAMTINEFKRLYRIPQDAAVDLCNIIRPYVPVHTSPQQTPLIRKLLVSLAFYGCGSYQRMIGRSIDCSLSQASVSRYIKEITMALNHPAVLTQFIKFPLTPGERAPVIQRNELMGMPRVLGYIDGFLVRLTQLPHDNERQSYFTRKGWTGLNVQIICDADLNILNVDARFPGSLNDHSIWRASAARGVVEAAYWEDRCWLLGDSGYYTAPWLHVPLPHAAPDTPEFDYTQLHCKCRNCVERCIGTLKARWRILCIDRAVNYRDATYCGCIVNACCVLHNFCQQRRLRNPPPVIEFIPDEGPEEIDLPNDIQALGMAEMNFLINHAHERRVNRNNIVNAL